MNNKEKWADDVINILENIQRVDPNPELFARINSNLFEKNQVKIIPLNQVKWVAAAACLFIAVNVYVISSNIKLNQTNVTTSDERINLVTEYTLYK